MVFYFIAFLLRKPLDLGFQEHSSNSGYRNVQLILGINVSLLGLSTLIFCSTKFHLALLQDLFFCHQHWRLHGQSKFYFCGTSIPEYGYHDQLATSQLHTNFLLLIKGFSGIEHLHVSNNLYNHSSFTLLPPCFIFFLKALYLSIKSFNFASTLYLLRTGRLAFVHILNTSNNSRSFISL